MLDNLIEYLLLFWLVSELFIIKWVMEVRPEKKITNKYDYKIQFFSHLPFGGKWKNKIDPSDLDLFSNYQKRIRIWYLSVIVALLLFYLYMFYVFI